MKHVGCVRLPPRVDIEREIARRSLYAFVKLAWSHVITEPFVDGWHIRALCNVLERVSSGEVRNVVINVPPGTGKSKITGVFWPAWDALFVNPARHWMYASFDASLLNNESQRLINLWRAPWFRERWGSYLGVGRPNLSEIKTLFGGVKFNTSFGGKGTGRHCHIQVIDDPIKPKDAAGGVNHSTALLESTWQTIGDTFSSRRIDPNTFARVLIMQRIHESDPSARALAEWEDVLHVCFPMCFEPDRADPLDERTEAGESLCPARFGPAFIVEQSKLEDVWATQYQQRPAVPGGTIIKESWVTDNATTLERARAIVGQTVQSWDCAFKDAESSDFVAGGWWVVDYRPHVYEVNGKSYHVTLPHFTLLDIVEERLSFVRTCNEMLARRWSWPCGEVLIEDKANGIACENALTTKMPGLLRLVTPKGPKAGRVHAIAPLFANNQVHLPADAPWFNRVKDVLIKFPRVTNDDLADMTSQALLELNKTSVWTAAMDQIPG